MKKTIGYILLESVLIGFSVFIAFWLENTREDGEIDKIKIEYYKRIVSDLKSDSIEWNKNKLSVKIQKGFIDNLIKKLKEQKLDKNQITIDLFRFEKQMLYYDIYAFKDLSYTFKSIINGERGNIFERDTTFQKIQQYYAVRVRYIDDINEYETYSRDYITPYMDKYFDRTCIRFRPEKRFGVEITCTPNYNLTDFQNRKFLNHIVTARDHLTLENYSDYIIDYCNKMINLVNQKIKLEASD